MNQFLDRRDFTSLAGSDIGYFDSAAKSLLPGYVSSDIDTYYRAAGALIECSVRRDGTRVSAITENTRKSLAQKPEVSPGPREKSLKTSGINKYVTGAKN